MHANCEVAKCLWQTRMCRQYPPTFAKDQHYLYVQVGDFEAIKAATAGMDIYLPERTTFYGSREIGVKDPAGHFIAFAHFEKQP